ncbi:hypothetical protein Syun_012721 [Stephania yunnanensis]|uniref:Uncharacterized protein n=1 Tax=Stephania yunnanensis TaxID=152371 RepID=A0AAP0PJQ8_9MAGN
MKHYGCDVLIYTLSHALTYVVSTTRACPYDGYLVTEADSKGVQPQTQQADVGQDSATQATAVSTKQKQITSQKYGKDISGNYTMRSFYHEVVKLQGVAQSLNKDCVSRMEPSQAEMSLSSNSFVLEVPNALPNLKEDVHVPLPGYVDAPFIVDISKREGIT